MRDILIKYVRDKNRKPIGTVVAVKQEKESILSDETIDDLVYFEITRDAYLKNKGIK